MKYFLTILLFMFVRPAMGQGWVEHKRPVPRNERPPQQQQHRDFDRPKKGIAIDDKLKRLRRLQDIKVAFMTREVNLSPAQGEKFWPMYRQYQIELNAAQEERHLNNSPDQPNGQDQVDRELAIEQKIVNIKRRYNAEFEKILPAEQVSQVYKSDRDFNDRLQMHWNEKRHDNANN